MTGGKRAGAGRKAKSELEKKKQKNIYIPEELYEEVMNAPIEYGDSFSSRCEFLIGEGLANFMVYKQNREIPQDKLTFIDLFAGIGGIRQAFEDEQTKAVFSSEWDKFAAATYEANFGEKPFGDITQIKEEDIPKHDVLLAGFPCQPFSMIGKREGFSHATQGTLFFDVLRIIKYHQPKMFLLENVQGLLTIQNGETFRIIKEALKEAGYHVFSDVLDAQNYGLPQVRKRVVIVGFREDLGITDYDLPQGSDEHVPVRTILEENPSGYKISEHLQKSYLFNI